MSCALLAMVHASVVAALLVLRRTWEDHPRLARARLPAPRKDTRSCSWNRICLHGVTVLPRGSMRSANEREAVDDRDGCTSVPLPTQSWTLMKVMQCYCSIVFLRRCEPCNVTLYEQGRYSQCRAIIP